MSGLTGLIDALLAVKASPRPDVLAIKAEAEIGSPGAVARVLKVENDIRLPSKAALDRVLPGRPTSLPAAAAPQQPLEREAELSVAARVISAVLADLESDPGPVRGVAPAWPSRQAPPVPELARALAQTVDHSGLFYESHLVEFASGIRPLAQLMQEPQAQWATPLAAQRAVEALAPAAASPGAATTSSPLALALAAGAPATEMPAAATGRGESASPAEAASPVAPLAARTDGAPSIGTAAAAAPADAARLQATYGRGEAARPVTGSEADGASDKAEEVRPAHPVAVARPATPAAEVIHPQAVSLVHQQLDLLATAVFRWHGEAWPGVPMDWSVEKDAGEPDADPAVEDNPQRWSTRVSMSLPRLGQVDVRLILAGPGLQARLAASEPGTVSVLHADGRSLVQRLEAAGLRVQELQVAPMEKVPADGGEGAS